MKTENIKILGIETSCDETSASVVCDGREILSNSIYSQIDLHSIYGGVVPEVASRSHIEKINPILLDALKNASIDFPDLDAVAVTYGPGLVGSLLVGLSAAKAICLSSGLPLIGINHIEGHICANYLSSPTLSPPFLCLVVSGGHTQIVLVKEDLVYQTLGKTKDDAIGEAYDKIARVLGLGYPGGPKIDRLAKELGGMQSEGLFPRAYLEEGSFDFSFSGVKSSVINYIHTLKMKGTEIDIRKIAFEFQEAVLEVVVEKLIQSAKIHHVNQIAVAGGVAANSRLRDLLNQKCSELGLHLFLPRVDLCTDNAAMIASAGYYRYKASLFSNLRLNSIPNETFHS